MRSSNFAAWVLVAAASVGSLTLVTACAKHEKSDNGLPQSDLPAAVRAGFERTFPQATLHEVEKETYRDGTVHWELEFVTRDGKKMEKEFDAAGELLPDEH